MSPEIHAAAGTNIAFGFSYYEDWWSDTVVVGCALTSDNGNTWTPVWDLHATGNVGPENVNVEIEAPGNFQIGFYYTGNSNNIDFFYADNISLGTLLTPPYPPGLLQARAIDSVQKVSVSWNPGWAVSGLYGYELQRKTGMPLSASPFVTIATTDLGTLFFEDYDVQLNQSYTYRVRSLVIGADSHYGNEATAYVPEFVPVELVSFTASIKDDNVNLRWITASEINNSGFEIERSKNKSDWILRGFIEGNGTTTEQQFYSFIDENLAAGKYQYRLKQIDFDGSFEYSEIVEVEVGVPDEFSLSQNYPNPFNPETSIEYRIGSIEKVSLKVYDMLGRKVATLVNEIKEPGIYEVKFDAGNLSSGIYYYALEAGNFRDIKKLILLK
jgi:hypothetical protein